MQVTLFQKVFPISVYQRGVSIKRLKASYSSIYREHRALTNSAQNLQLHHPEMLCQPSCSRGNCSHRWVQPWCTGTYARTSQRRETGGGHVCSASAIPLPCKKKKKLLSHLLSIYIFRLLLGYNYLGISLPSICAGKTGPRNPGRTCCLCSCPKGQPWKGWSQGFCSWKDSLFGVFLFPLKKNSEAWEL